jgi:16S rRNA (cytidine1402-2'-O)-methyltransferase
MTSTLYLLPVPLDSAAAAAATLPQSTLAVARATRYFLAENARSARAFLKAIDHPQSLSSLAIVEIGHNPEPAAIDGWLRPLQEAQCDAAIVSEAGCPGVADPGATIVARAHQLALTVRPLVGPSAPLLAIMGSGMDGQHFRFLGYLPQEATQLAQRLAAIENDSRGGESQIFIETPYRNRRLFDAILTHCAPTTRVCVALGLTAPDEALQTRTVAQWRSAADGLRAAMQRRPAVFMLQAGAASLATSQRQSGARSAPRSATPRRAPKRRATRSTRSSGRV